MYIGLNLIKCRPEETVDSLTELITKWIEIKNLKIEECSKTNYYTVSPATMQAKWLDPKLGPINISARQ